MAIRIITDSASDITQEEARTWGIQVLPLRTIFGEEEFLDGVTIDHQTFFQRLIESDVLPTTSQLSPFQYEGPFQEAVKAGDEVVCITLSSKLSGCYQSAVIAAEGLPVVLVDSLSVTVGQRILVELALQLRDQGLSAQEIGAVLEQEKPHIRLIALLDTLEYLKKADAFLPPWLWPVLCCLSSRSSPWKTARSQSWAKPAVQKMAIICSCPWWRKAGGLTLKSPFLWLTAA